MKGDNKNRRHQQAANAGRRKRRRTGRRTIHHVLLLLFFLGAGLVLSLTVFFKVEAVNVIGTDKYDPLELAKVSGVAEGDNLFRISKEAIIANLTGPYPYIESVEVSRRIPSTVEITVTQSVPSGAVKEGENYVLITADGKVLERGTIYIPENIPLIKGLDTTGVEPGGYLGAWEKEPVSEAETEEEDAERKAELKEARLARDAEKAAKAKTVKDSLVMVEYLFKAIAENDFTSITNVDVTDRLNMTIMYENRLLLELGTEADLPYKLELIRETIASLPADARGSLDASRAMSKRWVVFAPVEGYEASAMEEEASAAEEEAADGETGAAEEAEPALMVSSEQENVGDEV